MSIVAKERKIRKMLDIDEGTKREAMLDIVIEAIESRLCDAAELGGEVAKAFGCEPDDVYGKVDYFVRDLVHIGGDGRFGTVLELLERAEDACVRAALAP